MASPIELVLIGDLFNAETVLNKLIDAPIGPIFQARIRQALAIQHNRQGFPLGVATTAANNALHVICHGQDILHKAGNIWEDRLVNFLEDILPLPALIIPLLDAVGFIN